MPLLAPLLELLRAVPLLSSLAEPDIKTLAGLVERVRFSGPAVIVQEGDLGDSMYLIESGHAIAYKADAATGQPLELARYGWCVVCCLVVFCRSLLPLPRPPCRSRRSYWLVLSCARADVCADVAAAVTSSGSWLCWPTSPVRLPFALQPPRKPPASKDWARNQHAVSAGG